MSKYLFPYLAYRFDIEWFRCIARRGRISKDYPDGITITIIAPNQRHTFSYDYNMSKDEIRVFTASKIRVLLLECDARVQEYACQIREQK